MCNFTAKLKYNLFTLYPRTQKNRADFWVFRCQDVAKMTYIIFVFHVIRLLQYVATVIA